MYPSWRAMKKMSSPIHKATPNPIHFQASELFCRYPLVRRDNATNTIIGKLRLTDGRIRKATRAGHDNGCLASSSSSFRLVSTEYAIVDTSVELRFLATSSLRAVSTASGK